MSKIRKSLGVLLLLLIFIVPVAAAITTTKKLDLYIINAPSEEFYTDLVINDQQNLLFALVYRYDYDYEMWDQLYTTYQKQEAHLGMIDGTYLRMEGNLVGEIMSNGSHKFHYEGLGVPNDFKVVTLTKSGELKESMPIKKSVWYERITYDYASGEIIYMNKLVIYLQHFVCFGLIFGIIKSVTQLIMGLFKNKGNRKGALILTLTEIIIASPFMSFILMKNGNLGQGCLVLMVVVIVVTFIEMHYFSHYKKVDVISALSTALASNIIACIAIINLMQYAFYFFL